MATELPEWAGMLRTLERYNRFLAEVHGHFARTGERVTWGDGTIRIEDGPAAGFQCGLLNVAQNCAALDEQQWGDIVSRHFDAMQRSHADAQQLERTDYAELRPRLVVRAWDERDIDPSLRETLVHRPLLPGLTAFLAIDLPASISTVRREDAARWGVGFEEAFAAARENVMRLADAQANWHELEGGAQLMVAQGESFYNAATIREIDRFEGAVARDGAFVSAPTRNVLLAMPFDGAATLAKLPALLAVTRGMERDGPGSVSARVWWCRRGSGGSLLWTEVPYSLDEGKVEVFAPEELGQHIQRMSDEGR